MSLQSTSPPGSTTVPSLDPPEPREEGEQPEPPSHRHRLPALDVLRGIAILGTLATNIGIFALSSSDVVADEPRWHTWLGTAIGLVTDGKWIGLLTIMFGIGLEIQRQSARRRGDTWLGTYPWRALLLIIDGLLNYIFIFEFDVLMGYGLTGLVVCVVMAGSPKIQGWVLALGVTLHLALMTFMSMPLWMFRSGGVDRELFERDPATLSAAQLAQVAEALGTTPGEYASSWATEMSDATASDVPLTYWGEVSGRLENFWGGRAEIPMMFVMGLWLFLVGAFLYRKGLFLPAGARLRRRVMLLSFGLGLPIDWATRLWLSEYTGTFNRYLTSTMVSLGVLALVAHVYARGRRPRLPGRLVSNVGKMALTCYLAQNLIASILFRPWGLGLADRWHFGVFNMILGFAIVGTILVLGSAWWMRRHDRGPVEWLWHQGYVWIVQNTTRRWKARKAAQSPGGGSPELPARVNADSVV